jgi:1,4-dihydroxy-2-naphthoate octaprenyltransferase
MLLGFMFLVLALSLGLPLAFRGGLPIVILGAVSLFLAYGYTGGPWPLAYIGLGDLFVFLFFGLFSVAGTFYLHTLTLVPEVALAGLQAGCLATVLIAINNLRDIDTDRTANKNTLAVRFGARAVRLEIVVLCLLSYLSISAYNDRPWVWLVLLAAPLAVLVVHKALTRRGAALNQALAQAGAQQWLFGLALCVGLVLH